MILKIELARLWADETWDSVKLEIDSDNPESPYDELGFDTEADDDLVICDRVAWEYYCQAAADGETNRGLVATVMIAYEWAEKN